MCIITFFAALIPFFNQLSGLKGGACMVSREGGLAAPRAQRRRPPATGGNQGTSDSNPPSPLCPPLRPPPYLSPPCTQVLYFADIDVGEVRAGLQGHPRAQPAQLGPHRRLCMHRRRRHRGLRWAKAVLAGAGERGGLRAAVGSPPVRRMGPRTAARHTAPPTRRPCSPAAVYKIIESASTFAIFP